MASDAETGVISRDIILSRVEREYIHCTAPGFLARLTPYLEAEE
jgi:hypothetical protein